MRHAVLASSFLRLAPVGLVAGCANAPPPRGVELKDLPVTVNRNLDLLFLIDDSASTSDYQINLANNFPRFLDVLSTIRVACPTCTSA